MTATSPPPLAGGGWGEGAAPRLPQPPPPNPLPQGEGENTDASPMAADRRHDSAAHCIRGRAGARRRRKLHGRVRACPEPRLLRPSSGSMVAELGCRPSVRRRGPILVRLPFIALFALSTWLMYRLGAAIADARAGLWAAVLLSLSPVFGVTTGTWVLPDGPLDCALLAAALCLLRALERGDAWLVAGNRALCWACTVLQILGGADLRRSGDLPAVEPQAPALAGDTQALARTGSCAAGIRARAGLERGA